MKSEALMKLKNVLLEPIHNWNGKKDLLNSKDARVMKREFIDDKMETEKFDMDFQVQVHQILNFVGE